MTIVLMALATFRLASLLADEPGPFNLLGHIRFYAPGELGKLLDCVWCSSVWIGLGFTALYYLWPEGALVAALPFALSTAAIVIAEVMSGTSQHRDAA